MANYTWIIVAIILGLLSHWVRALRWRMLMEPMGFTPKKLNVYMAVLIAYLANLALPRLGEVSRCGILTRYEKIPFNKSFGTVITERAVDLLTYILLFLLMVLTMSDALSAYVYDRIYMPLILKFQIFNPENSPSLFLILSIGMAFLVVLFFLFRKAIMRTKLYSKIYSLISGLLAGMKSLLVIRKPWLFIFYTIALWVLYFFMSYVVFFALPETSALSLKAGLTVLVFGSIGIMIVQGGIGIYPAIVAETLVLFSINSVTGYAMGWLIWSSQTIMVIVAGVFSLLLLHTFNRKVNGISGSNTDQNYSIAQSPTATNDLEV
jgi:hypothetical protein